MIGFGRTTTGSSPMRETPRVPMRCPSASAKTVEMTGGETETGIVGAPRGHDHQDEIATIKAAVGREARRETAIATTVTSDAKWTPHDRSQDSVPSLNQTNTHSMKPLYRHIKYVAHYHAPRPYLPLYPHKFHPRPVENPVTDHAVCCLAVRRGRVQGHACVRPWATAF